jgi:hypothetical protein
LGCVDNAIIAPDLAADASLNYHIPLSDWTAYNKTRRHLCLCIVTLHRVIRRCGPIEKNTALFHYHQAYAAQQLSQHIKTTSLVRPSPELFEDMNLFFSSQIQQSSYRAWRAHLDGAKTLLNLWGADNLMGSAKRDFNLYNFMMADIYGSTTAPSSQLSATHMAQHNTYSTWLGYLDVDFCGTLTPVPEEIVRTTIDINIFRATRVSTSEDAAKNQHDSVQLCSSLLLSLQAFDPVVWAAHLPKRTLNHITSWTLLARCFQAATILYLFQTCAFGLPIDDEHNGEDVRTLYYHSLSTAISELFVSKLCGGVHYKYVLWPMLMCGIGSVARRDTLLTRFLCESLEQMTLDLGTLSMREAAILLEKLESNSAYDITETSHGINMEWDRIFERAPLFLL